MAEKKQSFDAAANALVRNTNLIEASAGTGKTYAIAMLVLRFVTECSLKIEDILLVTFTRAATEELADRIRVRLVEARDLLQGEADNGDPTLTRWAATVEDCAVASAKIQRALEDIDRASIFTIHGFSQRVLREQALECGQLFDVELQPDIEALRLQVAEDYWRKEIYTLPEQQCGVLLSQFSNPKALYSSVSPLSDHYFAIEPAANPLQEAGKVFEQCLANISEWWKQHREALHQRLEQLIEDGKVKKGFTDTFAQWWKSVDSFLLFQNTLLPPDLDWLSNQGFTQQINGTKVRGPKKQDLLNELRLPDQQAVTLMQSIDAFVLDVRVSFTSFIITELDQRMGEQNLMSYSDLIVRLHRAVTEPGNSPLRKMLRQRYTAALIDEFQDTDILQWQIFSRIFGGKNHYLYLIGDPKQAVYRFRGADIYSYFKARESAQNILTLEKNYRSHPGMVDAVNSLFLFRDQPFLYDDTILGFSPVTPALTAADGTLYQNGTALENMVLCQLDRNIQKNDGCWTVGGAAAAIQTYVVEEIVRLLVEDITITGKDKKKRVEPGDIAILVRNNSHALEYQRQLQRSGVPAVVSSRNSVFQTEECQELYRVLTALAQPGSSDLLRGALVTPWFGLTGDEFYRTCNDDELFEGYHARFGAYAELWITRGLLVMMKSFLHEEKVYQAQCSSAQAERKIANITHLLELLQQAESDNMYGPLQLLQWLQIQMNSQDKENELRLEKDDDAVRVVTMHSAKGLEYPVVFCPYLWYRQNRIAGETRRVACTEDSGRILDLGSDRFEERRQRAESEETAEDLRLLYVAVTRAKLRCYTFFCDLKGRKGSVADSFDSPLGYLLFSDGRIPFTEQQKTLEERAAACGGQYVLIKERDAATQDAAARRYLAEVDAKELRRRHLTRDSLYSDWAMTSYSALASVSEYEDHEDIPLSVKTEAKDVIAFSDLPSGPNFGNVIHDVLESVPFDELCKTDTHRELIEQKCVRYGVKADIERLEKMLSAVVSLPVRVTHNGGKTSFSLADIPAEKCIKEMAFYFHLHDGSTESINRILANEKTVLPLAEKTLKGYLTGFVDLIFEFENKYYIADYKTNNLGDSAGGYEGEQLVKAMASHNYGLQYWLYSLVLHNHLKNVLSDYSFADHFGGVLYFFVRGMDAQGRGVFYQLPDVEKLNQLGRSLGGL